LSKSINRNYHQLRRKSRRGCLRNCRARWARQARWANVWRTMSSRVKLVRPDQLAGGFVLWPRPLCRESRSLGLGGDGNVFNGILASRTIGY